MATKSKLPGKIKSFKGITSKALSKVKGTTKKTKMDYPNIQQFTGPRTTASSAAEGRLKVAAKSKYRNTIKASIKKAKKKAGYLNMN